MRKGVFVHFLQTEESDWQLFNGSAKAFVRTMGMEHGPLGDPGHCDDTVGGLELATANRLGVKRYECPYCRKRFSATNNLRGHLVHHTGIKEFVCQICRKEFRYKQDLKKHLEKCAAESLH